MPVRSSIAFARAGPGDDDAERPPPWLRTGFSTWPSAPCSAGSPAPVKGWGGDFEKSQPYKSDYTTSQNTYQTCPKRPR
eukprot:3165637-Prymnesium_polylepis.1